jgi:hypothetical protein
VVVVSEQVSPRESQFELLGKPGLCTVQEFMPVLLEDPRECEVEEVGLDRFVADVERVVVGVEARHTRAGVGEGFEMVIVIIEGGLSDAAGRVGGTPASEGTPDAINLGRDDNVERRTRGLGVASTRHGGDALGRVTARTAGLRSSGIDHLILRP